MPLHGDGVVDGSGSGLLLEAIMQDQGLLASGRRSN